MLPTSPSPASATFGGTAAAFTDFLVGELLADSLDFEATLRRLAASAVPDLADVCLVHVVGEDGALRLVAAAPGVPERLPDGAALDAIVSTGEAELRGGRVSVPLAARGRRYGVFSLMMTTSGRLLRPGHVRFAEDLVGRAALIADNARLYEDLTATRDELRVILDGIADGITVQNAEGRLVFANDAAAKVMGFETASELLAAPIAEVIARYEILDEAGAPLGVEDLPGRRALEGEATPERILRSRLRDSGSESWSVVKARPLRDAGGTIRGAINIFTDITLLRAEAAQREELAAAQARASGDAQFRAVVESAPDGIVGADERGRIVLVNGAAAVMFGYRGEDLMGMPGDQLLPERFRPMLNDARRAALRDDEDVQALLRRADLMGVRKDGSEFPIAVAFSRIDTDSGRMLLGTIRDITERKAAEERIAYLAYHDALTGLPNRAMLEQHLERAVEQAARRGRSVALLNIDLDEFKMVNDSLGHLAGDELLRQVGARLATLTRGGDVLARQGGDEFLLLADDLETPSGAAAADVADAIAARIHEALRDPFPLEGTEFRLGASVGVSLYPHDAQDADDLLRHADAALYSGKAAGRGRSIVYGRMASARSDQLSLTTRLRRAVENGEFVLHWQPIVELGDGSVRGFEGLVRWDEPERGLLPPAEFIPSAEGLGLIEPLWEWVLGEACRQATAWAAEGHFPQINLNLSPRQVLRADLVGSVLDYVTGAGLEATRFTLELTESAAMSEMEGGMETMRALSGAGFKLAIDDFGTGYSSLARLSGLPVNVLKIDRSFVAGLDRDRHAPTIVKTVVDLANSLRLEPVAEGIETAAQLVGLRALGCRFGQGYLLGRPTPAADVPLDRVELPVPARAE